MFTQLKSAEPEKKHDHEHSCDSDEERNKMGSINMAKITQKMNIGISKELTKKI